MRRDRGQSPVVAIYNASGTKLVSYTYDAWGNATVVHHNSGEYERYEKNKMHLHDPDEYCYFFLNNYSDYPLYAASLYEDDGDLTLTYIIYYDTNYKSAHDTYDGIRPGGANEEFPFSQDYLYDD